MMGIIISILKITGIVLASLIGLILMILLLVLFVPVRYRISANKGKEDDMPAAGAKATWLLHILSACFKYDEGKTDLSVRIFGIRLKSAEEKENRRRLKEEKKREKEKKAAQKKTGKKKNEIKLLEYDESNGAIKEEEIGLKGNPRVIRTDESSPPVISDKSKMADGAEKAPEKTGRIASLIDKIIGAVKSFKMRIEKIIGKISKATSEIEYYHDALFNDHLNREALSYIKAKLIRLLKSIAPKSFKGRLIYGGNDPADTGKVLAVAAMAYPIYGRDFRIEPDFENRILDFDATMKGRIYLNVVLVILLKLYMNKKVKRFIRIMKKENSNGR